MVDDGNTTRTDSISGAYTIQEWVWRTGDGSTTWEVPTGVTEVRSFLVGGGGGGGSWGGGGGGGGSLKSTVTYGLTPGASLTIVVAPASDAAPATNPAYFNQAPRGNTTTFETIPAPGGYGGWGGGAGVGIGGDNGDADHTGGAYYGPDTYAAGGGAGDTGDGYAATEFASGGGGAGTSNSLNGTATTYGGGGGGGGTNLGASQGSGADGGGDGSGSGAGGDGAANHGGGGGGGYTNASGTGGKGGSGKIVIKYLTYVPADTGSGWGASFGSANMMCV